MEMELNHGIKFFLIVLKIDRLMLTTAGQQRQKINTHHPGLHRYVVYSCKKIGLFFGGGN